MASKNEKSLFIKIGGKVAQSLGKSVDEAEKQLGKIESAAKTIGKATAVGLAAAGTAAVALGKEIYDLSTDYSRGVNQLTASLGLSAEEAEEYGETIKNIYGDNFGESFEEIAENVALVSEQLEDLPVESIEEATEYAYLLNDVFKMDIPESIRGADAMIEHLGATVWEAYNLMAIGAEKGLNQNGDLADQIAEYAVYYGNLGFTAEEAMNMMLAGAESGVYQIDKLNDAVKEFSIRSIDGSASTADAFKALGYSATEMSQIFANGGEASADAFTEVVNKIAEIDDAVLQDAVGVGLFGTMWEDVGADAIFALGNVQNEIDLTRDKLEEMNEVKYDDLGSMLMGLLRSVELLLLPLGDELIPVIQELVEQLEPLILSLLEDLSPLLIDIASDLLPPVVTLVSDVISAVLPVAIDLLSELIPIINQIIFSILPVLNQLLSMLMPIIEPYLSLIVTMLNSALVPILDVLLNMISAVLEPLTPLLMAIAPVLELIGTILEAIAPLVTVVLEAVASALTLVGEALTPIIEAISVVVGWVAEGLTWLIEAFMGGNTSAADESVANVATYAQGGWAYEPSIFGEAGPEVAISFDPAYRKENIGYWQEAGYLLGVYSGGNSESVQNTVETINYFDNEPVSEGGESGGVTIIFAPNLVFNGNASTEEVEDIVAEAYQRFKTFMERYAKENRRVRFEV